MADDAAGWVTVESVPSDERVALGDLPYEVLISDGRPDRHRVRAMLGPRTLVVQVDGHTCVTAPVYADGRAVTRRGGCVAANGTRITVEVRRRQPGPTAA